MNASTPKSERLFCLDALRGLDMLFLTVLQGLILAVAERLVCGGVKAALSPELYRVVFLLTVTAVLTASLVVRRRLKEWKSLSNAAKKDQMP